MHFISDTSVEFTTELRYHKDFPGATMPGYSQIPQKWILAYNYYEKMMAYFSKEG
jgi:hypothetical protein